MDYFIDIQIKPDAEIRENVLLNKVYTKLHKALYDLKSTDIGVSFPEYKLKLGSVIRIHAVEKRLEALQQGGWLGGLIGYCAISLVQSIPDQVQYRTVSRIQSSMSPAKLKRLIKRGSIRESEIKQYKAKMFQKGLDNPFLELESGSNGHLHRRYLAFSELMDKPMQGEFDQFGLSKTATIPWF
ncbi:type I-F CRISPR-associated endoribonuclease Cas6/Csy4 [Methylotuvimicrobium buryatense]|uniref:Type I-F CRISPR-associated endoribonuclease Cas6/Csy4 n=1 Tax=Methylotuvimicrobium buryatense TaxID=95641 RepID=A0A4V1IK06_METBY|nr:type I-F CRISPR-associated endoribonuclease Cas6/Csy4 [Methylotuvimicrobium buryatense]QCW83235.1 type I-F CRISPR-associated endoribonuclease Cas6/Csy4 [Methylotuvimicrobium buryatense]